MGTLLLKRGIAAVAAGAVSLATVPAFALSIGVNGHSDTALTIRNRHAQANASASADAEVRPNFWGQLRSGMNVRTRSSASAANTSVSTDTQLAADVQASTRVWTKVRDRLHAVLEHAIKAYGKAAKRFCLATNDTDATRNSCVAGIKAEVQAKVTAWINASF